ncbi:MAG: sodium/solute symporter [Pirellulales bacterium]|nr:sodium/solute symporter [Pirellulales bacterium]
MPHQMKTSIFFAVAQTNTPRGMTALDWIVIAAYAFSMLAIGWYYARRTTSTGDYLLGGRKIGSLSLGLSLFATMLSALTYLALPGEVIKNGPVFAIGKVAAYPLVAVIVGWFLVPRIMKLSVTSVYEILEVRLGLSVRMLGSMLFLTLRLMWMAVVIYATSSKVLVPLLGLEQSATPYFCVILGAITVAYTTMGGLRAVVLTDVIQTFILFTGALLTLGLISYHFGGPSGWWPSQWPAHWPAPEWGYDPNPDVRTFAGVFTATILWFVCTQGSDQMTVQRFLASRDVKAARRTLIYSLACSAGAAVLLTLVGLALMAYFQDNPQLLPGGKINMNEADKLFPQYIALVLPPGLSGLVMAGLLAAAMSSLSSGVNSSCSVIIVDFVDRFRKKNTSEAQHVKLTMCVSAGVGIVVVLLSMFVGVVQGNLLAVTFKVCNLLTAPLFGLMFMAMFVRWATVPGTLVGAACGLVVVIGINFWEEMTGTKGISFLWSMPLGLISQIGFGAIVSLLPLGRRSAETDS